MPVLLSDTIDEYLVARRSGGYKASTIRNDALTLRELLAMLGNIQVRSVTERHIDNFMAAGAARGLSPSTMNLRLAALRGFFTHCTHRRYVPSGQDPTAHRRKYRDMKRSRLRVPVLNFARMLDAAGDPRDRVVIALGLYLLLRESEIRLLRLGDVDLTTGTIAVVVPKSSKTDAMPICVELDRELRRWLTFYSEHADRSLRPTDALVPSWRCGRPEPLPSGIYRVASSDVFEPSRHYSTPHRSVQAALIACGYATHDENGKSLQEGVHTLRRSAARARFDALAGMGVDKALRHVQATLHHAHVSTTEHYIGLDADMEDRDNMLRGEIMFPVAEKASALRKVGT